MKETIELILSIAWNESYSIKEKQIRIEMLLIHFESKAKCEAIEAICLK